MNNGVYEDFFDSNNPPNNYEETMSEVQNFCKNLEGSERMIALVTSGGTTVPLEHNTVRFVDNFSGGNRGSASAEYFLDNEYYVIFLHRSKSLQPFSRHFTGEELLDALTIKEPEPEYPEDPTGIEVVAEAVPILFPIVQKYKIVKKRNQLLCVEFTTLSDYLWLLRGICKQLKSFKDHVLVYLAAAVSDFYIPANKMPKHKMQSEEGAPTISLHLVPKMLKPLVAEWVPEAFVVSFKLETKPELLLTKARAALETYKHQLVIGNILDTRKYKVTVVEPSSHYDITLTLEERDADIEIELRIVEDVCRRHGSYVSNNLARMLELLDLD